MSLASIHDAAFPQLNSLQLGEIGAIAERVEFEPESVLIRQGSKNFPFFVIESGEVRIVEKTADGEVPIATHGPGHFTGDVDMITGRASLIEAVANGPVVAYQMCAQRLRKALNACPDFSDLLVNAFQSRRQLLESTPFVGVELIGDSSTAATSRMREFFYKNHVPHTLLERATPAATERIQQLEAQHLDLPLVHYNGQTLSAPPLPEIAELMGISRNVDGQLYDLVIVGSGPAGLAASVYAASEGIRTLVIDQVGPGGQAGSSSKIENFMGFPSGLSGSDLANRGYLQALKFGAHFIAPISVLSIDRDDAGQHCLHLCTGQTAHARCVLIASGVSYRQLGLPGCRRLEGAGVFYAATSVEARVCEQGTAVVVGGGNSAGQAAMFLAQTCDQVRVLIRGGNLASKMSAYLCDRVSNHPKIQVMTHSELDQIEGTQRVESVDIRNNQTGQVETLPCQAVFTFIGAKPHTDWLPQGIRLDERGFVLTGSAVTQLVDEPRWPLERAPCDLETTIPGILAAGDVRAGTTKRCGAAVGDGSLAVACIHHYLSDLE